ncbi:glycosyltransferase [Amycolatopsis sp. NPDC050768]|uniref:glycosyltransferase n=1 Tax=Amycolatopsis sp. NPDC050768 TaxID=3154839 RepID=UPI0033E6C706
MRYLPVHVVILAKDEERCIGRCLDSVIGRGFSSIVVLDTGSVDSTCGLAASYEAHGVQLVRIPWMESFAAARNRALELFDSVWVFFVDADEWLPVGEVEKLFGGLSALANQPREDLAIAPVIYDVDRDSWVNEVPRVFFASGCIEYRGEVHEYPVVSADGDSPVRLHKLNFTLNHDGYGREVAVRKRKTQRNLALLSAARERDPENPRWLYFSIRDGLPLHSPEFLLQACNKLVEMADHKSSGGDRTNAGEYLRRALPLASQNLGFHGWWSEVERNCVVLDELDGECSPDAQYLRRISDLWLGGLPDSSLSELIRIRKDDRIVAKSTLCPQGRHLDAVIAAGIEARYGGDEADRYRDMCAPWDDMFFVSSRIRMPQAELA